VQRSGSTGLLSRQPHVSDLASKVLEGIEPAARGDFPIELRKKTKKAFACDDDAGRR
jgi:hypothetical protein